MLRERARGIREEIALDEVNLSEIKEIRGIEKIEIRIKGRRAEKEDSPNILKERAVR